MRARIQKAAGAVSTRTIDTMVLCALSLIIGYSICWVEYGVPRVLRQNEILAFANGHWSHIYNDVVGRCVPMD